MHHRTKSTLGFSSANALTDAAGGTLSLAQLLLDASPLVFNDATLITGDLPKLGLATLSMLYSSILIGQHLVYGDGPAAGRGSVSGGGDGGGARAAEEDGDGTRPLLG
jgi:cystinosin